MSGKNSRAEGGGEFATLTRDQRQYLAGFSAKDSGAERKAREKIRKRIQETIFDLQLLFYHLETADMRMAFEGGHSSRDGPISRSEPRDMWGRVGPGYGLGYPREGDKSSGYDGKSELEATIENVLENNPNVSKSSPGMQRALTDAVAFICRAAEAGQLDVNEVVERGLDKYHRIHRDEKRVVTVTEERARRVCWEAKRKIKHGDRISEKHLRALEMAGLTPAEVDEYYSES